MNSNVEITLDLTDATVKALFARAMYKFAGYTFDLPVMADYVQMINLKTMKVVKISIFGDFEVKEYYLDVPKLPNSQVGGPF